MQLLKELFTKTTYYSVALVIVLLGYNSFSSLDKDSEDFLYLSRIVKSVTDGKETQSEKLKALTDWLSSNVIKSKDYPGWGRANGYPDWFDGSSIASVIKGGIGNCGYQANNIITLSRYVGVNQHRRYWVGKQSGSEYQHAFAEMVVDGKPGIFDPNALGYVENKHGDVLSLQEIVQNPSIVDNEFFRKVATEIGEKPDVLRLTGFPETPLPLGRYSYNIYAYIGERPTKLCLYLTSRPLIILSISLLVFIIFIAIKSTIIKRSA